MKLRSPERLFGLDEEIDRRLPRVRSLRLIRAERYGGWLKCSGILLILPSKKNRYMAQKFIKFKIM